ncbi:MAG: M28 family peptidase [Vicingaceae bacterium]
MKHIVLSLFLCASLLSVAQKKDLKAIKEAVEFLAADELEGRETGTKGEKKAAEFIAGKFKEMQIEPMGTEGYFQNFSVTPKANPHSNNPDTTLAPINGKNVVGMLNHGAEYTVVIGAHYDHLGVGAEGSLYAGKEPQIHNGADDNASGIALMLALAHELGSEKYNGFNYLFIAFSGEEKGLWGSNYYAKNPTIELEKVNYMINFDMVGRLDTAKGLAINGVGTAPNWMENLEIANETNLKLITSESGVGPSDHTSFYLVDIPVLHFFTGQHSDYHKPSDDADKVNYEGIATIEKLVLALIEETEGDGKMEFQKTKTEEKDTPRFTVTLGVMPDYMFQGDGMRIDGVTDGRPASKAGFEKGDIVIQMGEHQVEGMQSYMQALSKFKKGDKAMVKVKRGKKEVESEVTF